MRSERGSLVDVLATMSVDQHIRGRQFEELCRWFLLHDPLYRAQVRRVWLWKDWPGRWGADAGIDLVAETFDKALWAVQAKAYDPQYSLKKQDIDSFLSESAREAFSYRLVIATTNRIGPTAQRTLAGQSQRAGLLMRGDLERSQLLWPKSVDMLRALTPARKKPREHNRQAVNDVCRGLKRSARGQLIMACGTGKTLVGMWVAERLRAQRTLVLIPSLSLLAQTMREWTANATKPFIPMAVCSDSTVATDDFMEHTFELGVPVTTDPSRISEFLAGEGRRVVFSTYHSSPLLRTVYTTGGPPPFDLAIADEAHRCAGSAAAPFAAILHDSAIPATKRLFMTATPRYMTGRIRAIAQREDYPLASMDDESVFGRVLHHLSFDEAIERGLLADYQVAVIGVNHETYRRYVDRATLVTTDGTNIDDASILASHIGLAKAMRRFDLRRVITFHSRIARARRFSERMPEVVAWLPPRNRPSGQLWSTLVSGEMSTGKRDVLLNRFRYLEDGERGLLANARCLGEGIDLPAIDGVAFIDSRRSQVDVVQAVGRAIRLSPKKTVGTIVLPVFIDTDQDPTTIVGSSAFAAVWEVLLALRAHDGAFAEQLDEMRREYGRRPDGRVRQPGKLITDLPVTVGSAFVQAFRIRLLQETTAPWEEMFGRLETFVTREGHARVPVTHRENGRAIGGWVDKQRQQSRQGTLSTERHDRLQQLPGWTWHAWNTNWDTARELLVEYVAHHGTTAVPDDYEQDGIQLGAWVGTQRAQWESGRLGKSRIERMEQVPGWTWVSRRESAWERDYAKLRLFVEEHGHARVPTMHQQNGFRLGGWVTQQRTTYSSGRMAPDRQQLLEVLPGWIWGIKDARWEQGYAALAKTAKEEGTAVLAARAVDQDGFRVGQWCTIQRTAYKAGRISPEHIARLESLAGWSWNRHDTAWETAFTKLLAWAGEHGHARIPVRSHGKIDPLGQWVDAQRQANRNGTLTADRIHRLEALPGWVWNEQLAKWEDSFTALRTYCERKGAAGLDIDQVQNGKNIGQFAQNQRGLYKRGKLTPDRIQRLQELPGWWWTRTTCAGS